MSPEVPRWDRRRLSRQALGIVILVLAFVPLFRFMDTSVEAPHRQVSAQVADLTLQLAWWGTIVTVLLAWVLARLRSPEPVRRVAEFGVSRLARLPLGVHALMVASISTALAALTGLRLYRGYFTNVDEIASTLHARYLANGMLAGPTFSLPEFWLIPNTLVVPEGWVSQFPPTHLVAMAVLIRLGAPTLLGPLSLGAMTGLVALSLPRLLPERQRTARVAGLAVAVCPFLVLLGGGSMSHVTAGALGAAVLYSALRARDGGTGWAVVTGAAIGLLVADRPLVGLVLGALFTLGAWVPSIWSTTGRGATWLAVRLAGTALGGAPFALLLAWYNQRLFGSPLTLGYLAAFGERHRLGFHVDPWGYEYGLAEAVGFTSSDVLAAGVQLLETPFPATAVIGVWLLTTPRFPRGAGLLVAWAFLPVVANAYYWFHDARMLYEAVPAWVTLVVLASGDLAEGSGAEDGSALGLRFRDVFTWAMVVGAVVALAWGVPDRVRGYSWSQETLDRIVAPLPPDAAPSIVFVHVSWNERLSATLQGAGGMRQDTVISALRRNTNCDLHRYAVEREARARERREVTLPALDLEQAPGTHPDIERPISPSGASVRIRRGDPFPESCRRELASDRLGAVALAPLAWQGDLPGIEQGRPLYVRDLGPEKNALLLERYPTRDPYVFVPTTVGEAPALVPYDQAMELLWAAPPPRSGSR